MAETQQSDIRNRQALFNYLSEQMNSTYFQVLEGKRVEKESTYVKTYLLEYDWNQAPHDDEPQQLASSLSVYAGKDNREPIHPVINSTDERGFYTLTWPSEKAVDKQARLYLDTSSDPERRFWIGYSLSEAGIMDGILDKVVAQQAALDRVWLWPNALQQTQGKGEFRGIGLEYDYRRFDQEKSRKESTEYLKLQLWGGAETREILDFIQTNPKLRRRMVVSKIRMRYFESNPEFFAIEELKYNGKFLTKGTSFTVHQSLVTDVRERYSSVIKSIEQNHVGSGFTGGDHKNPVFFRFDGDSKIEDVSNFCRIVFSGSQPFRLWGVPEKKRYGNNSWKVNAVDLHTGSRLYFEVYPDMICMGLLEGACGNTVARFYTNLQQSYSHQFVALDGHGSNIFQYGDSQSDDRSLQAQPAVRSVVRPISEERILRRRD